MRAMGRCHSIGNESKGRYCTALEMKQRRDALHSIGNEEAMGEIHCTALEEYSI